MKAKVNCDLLLSGHITNQFQHWLHSSSHLMFLFYFLFWCIGLISRHCSFAGITSRVAFPFFILFLRWPPLSSSWHISVCFSDSEQWKWMQLLLIALLDYFVTILIVLQVPGTQDLVDFSPVYRCLHIYSVLVSFTWLCLIKIYVEFKLCFLIFDIFLFIKSKNRKLLLREY